jgi:hypothetical protein
VFSGRNRLDAFCRGTDNQLWTRTWKNTTGWGNWSSLGGQITSDPDAASPGDASQLVVVARGTDNAVWQYFLQGGQWLVQSLGGICTSGPSAVYSGAGREDVFCRGTDGQPWNRTWKSDTGWNGWSPIGGLAASDLDAVSQGDGFTPQVFARGTDGAVWQWLFSQNSWRVQSWGQP